jgi:hypothetical protein
MLLGTVAHAYNHGYFGRWRSGGWWFKVNLGKKLVKTLAHQISWAVVVHIWTPIHTGYIGREIAVVSQPGQKV